MINNKLYMKTVENEVRSWDDLIFENRNHAYGAYAVRKAYTSNVNRAAAITLGFAAAIAAWSFVSGTAEITHDVTPPDRPVHLRTDVTIIPQDLPRPQPAQAQHRRGNLPPVATAEAIEEVTEPVETNTFQPGSETGTDIDFVDGPLMGTGTESVVEASPVDEDRVWEGVVEVPAQYRGGMAALIKFVSRNMKYPPIARRMEIEGTVYVSFIVGKSGEILEAKVIKGIDGFCDAEALRVIGLMKEWLPGQQGGRPVKVRMVLPITFRISR